MLRLIRRSLLWIASPEGKKAFRYSVTSAVSLLVSQVSFVLLFGTHTMGPKYSSITATMVGAIPSYVMNRYWAFQKRGSNRLFQEVIPYLAMAVTGLIFSTWAVDFADSHTSFVGTSHLSRLIWVDGAYLGSFAILWVGKFVILNRILFAKTHHESVAPMIEQDPVI